MWPLICNPVVAVILLFILWNTLRTRVSFEHFPLPDYRPELEFALFFLPAGLVGWLSALVINPLLQEGTNVFDISWSLGLIVVFVICEFLGILTLAIGGEGSKAVQNAQARDFIALGVGYGVGVLVGTYQIIINQPQPPRIIFSLGEGLLVILLISMGITFVIILKDRLKLHLHKHRKKSKRLKGTTRQKKQLHPPEPTPSGELPSKTENQAHAEENQAGMK